MSPLPLVPLLLAAVVGVHAQTWTNPKDGTEFVWVDSKSSGFWMATKEVTVAQFRRFVRETAHVTEAERDGNRFNWHRPGFRQGPDHPVVWLGRTDAIAYARWAGVDVPTEAEWLEAAQGITFSPADVWHRENSPHGTHRVGQKKPDGRGLYDLLGNAWEWCRMGDDRECDHLHVRGSSWTRCPRYQMRDGKWVEPFRIDLEKPIEPKCAPLRGAATYDDDRGLRCVRRATSAAQTVGHR